MKPTKPSPQILPSPVITIFEPVTSSTLSPKITNVLCQDPDEDNPTGGICACGTATQDGARLTGVWAAVYGPGTLSGSVPSSPIKGATQCTDFDPDTGDWQFVDDNLVENTPCSPAPVAANNATFLVWFTFSDSTGMSVYYPGARDIATQCSNHTNCDGTGPSPCAERLQKATTRAGARASVAVETAPRQYKVQSGQARGPLASLVNTSWVLSLRTGGCGCSAVWINDGDGIRLPHVELRPDRVVASEWRLTLTLNGQRIRYTCPAGDWSPLDANRLVLAEPSESDDLPQTLTVYPV